MRVGAALPLLLTLGPAPGSDRRGGPAGNGFVTRFAEDLAALAAAGCTEVRIPFDWSRIEPDPGRPDRDALEWYGHVLTSAAGAGLTVWASLMEGPLPGWFADEGGWADASAAGRRWPRFVETVAEHFGDGIGGWVPLDRPTRLAARAYLGGGDPPGRDDPEVHARVLTHLVVAGRDAWRILHGSGAPVATAFELEVSRPTDDTVPAHEAARWRDRTLWNLWLQGLRDGTVAVPGLAERELADLTGSCDLLGAVISAPRVPMSDDVLARFGDDVGEVLRRLAEEAPERPLTVTLVGGPPDDVVRTRTIEAFGDAVALARRDGIAVEVVLHLPGIDRPGEKGAGILDGDRVPKPSASSWAALAP
jgi:beta-glucosidase